jgi:RNA-directed DNA polymerase
MYRPFVLRSVQKPIKRGRLMGIVLHAGAKTTHRARKEIHDSKESITTLAKRYGVNHKTIIKWRKRATIDDL